MKYQSLYTIIFLASAQIGETNAGKSKSRKSWSYRASESFDPRMMGVDTDEPTFAPVLNSATKAPTINTPGTSTYYEFTTPGAPTLNAQTASPVSTGGTRAFPTPNPSTSANPTVRPTLTPTYYYPTSSPSTSPSEFTPGSWYQFNTGPAHETPTLDAQIKPTHDDYVNQTDDSLGNYTVTDTPSETYIPTGVDDTTAPSDYVDQTDVPSGSYIVTDAPTETFVSFGADDTAPPTPTPSISPDTDSPTMQILSTSSPTGIPTTMPPVLVIAAATKGPSGNAPDANTTNVTEPCLSDNGSFFIARERQGNVSIDHRDNILSFAYELETAGRTDLDKILPELEAAFVDSILHVLFPSECESLRHLRLLQVQTVVGVKSTPEDIVVDGEACAYKLKDRHSCVVVDGMITIVSLDGDIEEVMEEAAASLIDSMERGDFVDSKLGIVRVSATTAPIEDEGVQEETDNSVIGDQEGSNAVGPVSDQGNILGMGLALCGAGALLVILGAMYRRKKRVNANDSSTFQEGVTINGLSRFDITHDDMAVEDIIRDVEIMPLSPAARTVSNHRYTSDGGSILTLR